MKWQSRASKSRVIWTVRSCQYTNMSRVDENDSSQGYSPENCDLSWVMTGVITTLLGAIHKTACQKKMSINNIVFTHFIPPSIGIFFKSVQKWVISYKDFSSSIFLEAQLPFLLLEDCPDGFFVLLLEFPVDAFDPCNGILRFGTVRFSWEGKFCCFEGLLSLPCSPKTYCSLALTAPVSPAL